MDLKTRSRSRSEATFEQWGHWIVRRRWAVIVCALGITAGLVSLLPGIEVDNSPENFLHRSDPERIRYDEFRELFDRDDRIIVVLHHRSVFELDFLEKLKALHEELEAELPYVEEITSLVNARHTEGVGDELVVGELLEEWPQALDDLEQLQRRVRSNPLHMGLLVSEDGRYTTITIKPFTYSTLGDENGELLDGFEEAGETTTAAYLTEDETFELIAILREVVQRHADPSIETHLIGGAVMNHRLSEVMNRDIGRFLAISIAVILVLLGVLFRRVSGVLLPLIVVVSSLASTMGIMVGMGIPLSITIGIMPSFLLVVGISDSVHILVIAFQRLATGATREEAIVGALAHSGLAVVMTSITTAAGLMSFSIAELAPIAELGVIAPVGVIMAMLYSLTLLPALLAISPLKIGPTQVGLAQRGHLDRFLALLGDLSTEHPWRVLAVALLVLLVGATGIARLRFSHDAMNWFPEQEPLKKAARLTDRHFGGTSTFEILIDSREENGFHEPATLRQVESAMARVEELQVGGKDVGKAISLVNLLKEIHRALNENQQHFYRLGDERELIAQEFLLFENSGSDDIDDVVDSQFQVARLTVRTPWVDAMVYPDFLEEVRAELEKIFAGELDFDITGRAAIFTRTFRAVNMSMLRSYMFALCVITPMMILLIGSLRRGLVAMIPNLIPVYMTLALAGWVGIPLDASTLLVGGIVIGLAVDDTIHFMHKFNHYFDQYGDAKRAVHETLATTGTALLFTSLVLGLGFAVYLFAYMKHAINFGLLNGFAVIVAFAADILIAPALMVLITRSSDTPSKAEPTLGA